MSTKSGTQHRYNYKLITKELLTSSKTMRAPAPSEALCKNRKHSFVELYTRPPRWTGSTNTAAVPLLNQLSCSFNISVLHKSGSSHDGLKEWSIVFFACWSKSSHFPSMKAISKRYQLCGRLFRIWIWVSLKVSSKFW